MEPRQPGPPRPARPPSRLAARLCLLGGVQPGREDPGRWQRRPKVWLWNLTNPAHPTLLGQPLTGPTNPVRSVAFSPDGKTLAAGSDDNKVWLWNVTDPAHPSRLGQPLTGPTGSVYSVAFSRDGKTLAAGSADNKVWLWNVDRPGPPQPARPAAHRPHRHCLLGGVQPGREDPGRRQRRRHSPDVEPRRRCRHPANLRRHEQRPHPRAMETVHPATAL